MSNGIPDMEDTVSKLYNGLSALQQQSKDIQKRDIEHLLKAVLGSSSKTQQLKPTSDTSSFHDSDDSSDCSRLRIVSESEHSDTHSNHSEQSESSGNTSTSTSFIHKPQTITIMRRLNQNRPLGRWNSLITAQNEEIPVVYHKSMARQFPAKDRTPEQMEMRRRNTEAARISRAKSKMAEMMMEKEATELSTVNTSIKRMIASQLAYANELCALLDIPKVKLNTFKRMGIANID